LPLTSGRERSAVTVATMSRPSSGP
jgi:hypothetical protein